MRVHEQMYTPEGVQAVAKEWWDCDIMQELAAKFSVSYIKAAKERVKEEREGRWFITAVGPLIWLKTKLNDLNLLPIGENRINDDSPTPVTAVLHIGFLCIHETDEMLVSLYNEHQRRECNNPARSKMFETAQKQDVTAIDRTAAIVSKANGG